MDSYSKKFITVKEAAKMLGVTPLTLRNWDNNGKLAAGRHPFNNYRVYDREDIENLLADISSSKGKHKMRTPRNKSRKLEVKHLS